MASKEGITIKKKNKARKVRKNNTKNDKEENVEIKKKNIKMK